MTHRPRNPMLHTLLTIQGNAKAAVWTEPLWGLSIMLVVPFATLFMRELGLSGAQVGFLATVTLLGQVACGICAGVITDKIGRRRGTAIWDGIAWVGTSLIFMVAQNFWFFLAGALIQSTAPLTHAAWDGLLIEDAKREDIPKIYGLVRVAADCAAFFAPIAIVIVNSLGLEQAVRILYANAAVLMGLKIFLLYRYSTETRIGKERLEQTRGVRFSTLMADYRGIFARHIWRGRGMIFSVSLMAVFAAVTLVNNSFWPLVVNEHLGVPDALIPLFPMLRSGLSIVLFFTLIPRLTKAANLKRPTLWGFILYLAGQILLMVIPAAASAGGQALDSGTVVGWYVYALLGATLLLDSFGAGMLFMLTESIVSLHVHLPERSRIMAILRAFVMLVAAPTGWITGVLFDWNRIAAFGVSVTLLAIGLLITSISWVAPHVTTAEIEV